MNFENHYSGQGYLDVAKKMAFGFKPQPPVFKRSVSEKSLPADTKPLTLKDKLKLEPIVFYPEIAEPQPANNGKNMFYVYSENIPQFTKKNIFQLS